MSRRDQFKEAYAGIYSRQAAPKTEQKRADKVCGECKHYLEGAFTGEGTGTCNILKLGSDISLDPPKFNTENVDGYRTMALMDATRCKYYEKMEFMDKDPTECSDP